jgi:fructose 1,6-bisphosphatase
MKKAQLASLNRLQMISGHYFAGADAMPSRCLTRSMSQSDQVKPFEVGGLVLGWMLGHEFSWWMLLHRGVCEGPVDAPIRQMKSWMRSCWFAGWCPL